jgi:L-cystine uptake protein TcyP (sodium:dicarboxylate symporter family)
MSWRDGQAGEVMILFLTIVLALVALPFAAVFVLAALGVDESENELARIEMEVRRAERRLNDVARDSFAAMLEEARSHERERN